MKYSADLAARPGSAAVAVAFFCVFGSAHAASVDTFSVFDSPGLNRQIHGRESDVDLAAGPMRLGDASAFFGVDSLSDDANHYLTSGLQWRSTRHGTPLLTVGAMHTVARGANVGSQTLMRAETRLALGDRWYLPDLTLETDQLSSSGAAGSALGGRATHVGFAHDFGRSRYRIAYFQADNDYSPWGSALAAGDRGMEMSGTYDLGRRWRLSNSLRVHRGDIATGTPYGVVDKWRVSGVTSPTALGRPWRLIAQFGKAGVSDTEHRTPLWIELASRTRRWRDWHVDSALGWYQGDVAAPHAMPVNGGLWEVSASRNLNLAGLQTRLQPSFSIGGSQYDDRLLGSRTGLAMGFPGLLDNVAFSVDYLSPGWGPSNDRPDMQMTLSIRQNAGAVVPRLGSMVDRLRGHWFGRD
ncbi:hypothetical protein [Salinisphaera sp. LB1]|uniref:hypothetical protein n=1 Tax=Salinisphaera sp. LB1 TaxID=2183911 RepID=UPI000D708BDC|nr:hypothetical protein [Salinisphaera sp. LB1]